jgi:PAP2 superfamily
MARRPRLSGAIALTQESGLVLGLYALWQFAGSFSVAGPSGAIGRAAWIWHFERILHLPSETTVQRFFLPHPLLIQFFNLYYDSLHFPVLIACMVWLFVRHRDAYRRMRTTLVLFTAASLVVQIMPVAPPRMLPSTGLVDTAILYHESVYNTVAGFDPDQLSAMPSVHVGWAILVAIAVIGTARTKWRSLAVLYPVMTTLVVVVTANHFWLDGIAAAILLMLALTTQRLARRILAHHHIGPSPALAAGPGAETQRSPAGQPGPAAEQLSPVCARLVVADDDPQSLSQHGGDYGQLATTDDGTGE